MFNVIIDDMSNLKANKNLKPMGFQQNIYENNTTLCI